MDTLADFKDFRQLSQNELLALLEGQADALTPLSKKREAQLRGAECPCCGEQTGLALIPHPVIPQREGEYLPAVAVQCGACGCLFELEDSVIIARSVKTPE